MSHIFNALRHVVWIVEWLINHFFEKNRYPLTNLEKIHQFQKLPIYKQKSQQWLDQRNNYLTASTIAAAIGAMGPVAGETLMTEKVSYGKCRKFMGNRATRWGVKYEPVAKAIYASRKHTKVYDFGLITNSKYPILGVSPDGITIDNMLEIKCPYSRVIDGKIKKQYYHQVQEQLTVCDFNNCDFIECKFKEVEESEFWPSNDPEKGIVIVSINPSDHEIIYEYSPIEYSNDNEVLKYWEQTTIERIQHSSTQVYLYHTYWNLETYQCQTIPRDPQWIIEYYPVLQKFWENVEHYRKNGLDQLLKTIQENRANRELVRKIAKERKYMGGKCVKK